MEKVSVVMATYNGEKYIEEQLKSLFAQSMQPDEVIISDDCSTDDTVSIIKEFIKKNNLEHWKVNVNSKNKGWKKNFFDTLCTATGDIIFMCDQDDIWNKNKIEVMYNAILKQSEILCLVGNYIEIDKEGKKLTKEIERADNSYIRKIQYTSDFYWNVYLGCTMCITKKMMERYRQFNVDFVAHDAVCAQIALLEGGLYYMPYITIEHRLHGNNATCIKSGNNAGNSNLSARKKGLRADICYLKKLSKQSFVSENEKIDIAEFIRCQQLRYNFVVKKSFFDFMKEYRFVVGGMLPFSKWVGDFAYAFGIHKQLGKVSRCLKR